VGLTKAPTLDPAKAGVAPDIASRICEDADISRSCVPRAESFTPRGDSAPQEGMGPQGGLHKTSAVCASVDHRKWATPVRGLRTRTNAAPPGCFASNRGLAKKK